MQGRRGRGPRWAVPTGTVVTLLIVCGLLWFAAAPFLVGSLPEQSEKGSGSVASADAPDEKGSAAYCDQHFGLGWLAAWEATARETCTPVAPGDDPDMSAAWLPPARLTCRAMNDTHMPSASAPHVLCDGSGILLDPRHLHAASCPRHRPGYLCGGRTYLHHLPGAWLAGCRWEGDTRGGSGAGGAGWGGRKADAAAARARAGRGGTGINLEAFSRDHQRDVFESLYWGSVTGRAARQRGDLRKGGKISVPDKKEVVMEKRPTLFVTRETGEHRNLYHTSADLLNAFITLRTQGWLDVPRRLVLLDDHPPSSLDAFWANVVAGGGGSDGGDDQTSFFLEHASLMARPTLFERVAFSPPGYTSLLLSHLTEEASCALPTPLFAEFRAWVWRGMHTAPPARGPGEPLRVVVVSRRPSATRRRLDRQIANEEALVEALRGIGQVAVAGSAEGGSDSSLALEVTLLDLATIPLHRQLTTLLSTDLLVGMHGAALSFGLLMPPAAGVLELWPKPGIWRCLEHMAHWGGLAYARWENPNPAAVAHTTKGDATTVDVDAVAAMAGDMLPAIAAARLKAASGMAAFA